MTEPKRCTPVSRTGWFKSSYSNASGSCVEVRFTSGAALVRDSKDNRDDQPVVACTSEAWASLLKNLALHQS
ncbi:hypothetical protein GCM10027258_60470 [Amycolatopsis stemonae]